MRLCRDVGRNLCETWSARRLSLGPSGHELQSQGDTQLLTGLSDGKPWSLMVRALLPLGFGFAFLGAVVGATHRATANQTQMSPDERGNEPPEGVGTCPGTNAAGVGGLWFGFLGSIKGFRVWGLLVNCNENLVFGFN